MYQSGKKDAERLGVKEESYWDFVDVENYICPILHNQINLGNNVFANLLDYGNENIESLSVDEDKARNSLLMIDSSIEEMTNLRDEFDDSNEGKELSSLKRNRKNDKTSIIYMTDDIRERDFRIEELSQKREILSNNVNRIKRYNFKLK